MSNRSWFFASQGKQQGPYPETQLRASIANGTVTAETLTLAPWLRTIATKMCKEMPYPISPELFWVRGGFWHLFAIERREALRRQRLHGVVVRAVDQRHLFAEHLARRPAAVREHRIELDRLDRRHR